MDSNANIKRLKHSRKRNKVQLSHRSELLLLPWSKKKSHSSWWEEHSEWSRVDDNRKPCTAVTMGQVPGAPSCHDVSPPRFLTGHRWECWMALPICISCAAVWAWGYALWEPLQEGGWAAPRSLCWGDRRQRWNLWANAASFPSTTIPQPRKFPLFISRVTICVFFIWVLPVLLEVHKLTRIFRRTNFCFP